MNGINTLTLHGATIGSAKDGNPTLLLQPNHLYLQDGQATEVIGAKGRHDPCLELVVRGRHVRPWKKLQSVHDW